MFQPCSIYISLSPFYGLDDFVFTNFGLRKFKTIAFLNYHDHSGITPGIIHSLCNSSPQIKRITRYISNRIRKYWQTVLWLIISTGLCNYKHARVATYSHKLLPYARRWKRWRRIGAIGNIFITRNPSNDLVSG